MLDVGAKRRLVGAVVLVVLAVVFLPMLLEDEAPQKPVPEEELAMPEPPPALRGSQAESFPKLDEPSSLPYAGVVESPEAAPNPGSESDAGMAQDGEAFAVGEPVQEPEPEQDAQPQEPAKSEAGKHKAAAETPAEKPNTAVPMPQAKPRPVPKGVTSWVVQVAALSSPESAALLEKKLRGKGFPAFVEKLEGTKRTLWRVRVGPEVERSRAQSMAADIKQQTGLGVYVRKYGGN